jgi:hypothetical protein
VVVSAMEFAPDPVQAGLQAAVVAEDQLDRDRSD